MLATMSAQSAPHHCPHHHLMPCTGWNPNPNWTWILCDFFFFLIPYYIWTPIELGRPSLALLRPITKLIPLDLLIKQIC